jgi:UDP-N-acetylmuramate dehydrogenase
MADNILNLLSGVQKNIPLADYTTFKIGGPARYFFVAKKQEEIISALQVARESKLPVFILAGGSNILFSDKGFDGLVIKILNTQYIIQDTSIIADTSVSLSKLVIESVKAGLAGLEWAMGIPGTIGGAVFGNAGAYGHSISESVDKVITISPEIFSMKEYKRNECGFVYRGSIFKQKNEIILEVSLKLEKGNKEESQKRIKDIILERKKKTPSFPSAGSFFKNYVLQKDDDPLIRNFPELAERVKGGKLGVGYLIDQCGLKGMKQGQAMVSHEHGNFIINLGSPRFGEAGGATAKDVLELAELCKQKVFGKYGIKLEEETRLVGF